MFGLNPYALVGSAVAGAIMAIILVAPMAYYAGKSVGNDEGQILVRTEAVEKTMTIIQGREEIDAKSTEGMSADAMCQYIGGVSWNVKTQSCD